MENKSHGKIIISVLVALLVFLCTAGGLYYAKVYQPSIKQATQESTRVAQQDSAPQKAGERILLAEIKESGLALYKDGDYIILSQDGQETEYSDWASDFTSKTPTLYYEDINNDGAKEILITAYENTDETYNKSLNGLYVISASGEAGNRTYDVRYTNSQIWSDYFGKYVTLFLNQPDASPDLVQFAMSYKNLPIEYDPQTGYANKQQKSSPNSKVWYATVPKANGKNCTLYKMATAPCVIELDKETHMPRVFTDIYAVYSEFEQPQYLGRLYTQITLSTDGKLTIASRSVGFSPNNEFAAEDPRK